MKIARCRTCRYSAQLPTGANNNKEMTCDYILVTKTRRPCPVSPNCTAYRPGKRRGEWHDN